MSLQPALPSIGRVELVVTDVDGTFADFEMRVPEATVAAASELERRGVPLLLATARNPRTTGWVLGTTGLQLPGVYLNGALGRSADSSTFHLDVIASGAVVQVLAVFAEHDMAPNVTVDHPELLMLRDGPGSSHEQYLAYSAPFTAAFGAYGGSLDDLHVVQVTLVGVDRAIAGSIAEGVREVEGVRVLLMPERTFGDGWTVMVAPEQASKWAGVERFCAIEGIDPARVLAIGDGENDLDLLAGAAVACAMSHAPPAVHEVAHHRVEQWSRILDFT